MKRMSRAFTLMLTLSGLVALSPLPPAWGADTLHDIEQKLAQDGSQENLNRLLVYAAYDGDQQIVEYLLAHGAQIDTTDFWGGQTPLMIAVSENQAAVVHYLVAQGANLNFRDAEGRGLVEAAMANPTPDLLRWLIGKGLKLQASTPVPLLCRAAKAGNTAMLEFLISQGQPIDAADTDGDTALGWAFDGGKVTNIAYLLAKGADAHHTNATGETALFLGVRANQAEITELFGAPFAKSFDLGQTNPQGDTPLHLAMRLGYLELAKKLVENGSDPLVKNQQGINAVQDLRALLPAAVQAPTTQAIEAALQQDDRSALYTLFTLAQKQLELESALKANMHTLQTTVETYAVDHQGVYPQTLAELYQEARAQNYWKEMINSVTGKSGLSEICADFSAQQPNPAAAGKVIYQIQGPDIKAGSYRLYGVDQAGDWLKTREHQVYSLDNT